ncbi:hypothetical protein D3C80_448590 [compost metagenome]
MYKIVEIDGRKCRNEFARYHQSVFEIYRLTKRRKWWIWGEVVEEWVYVGWTLSEWSAHDRVEFMINGPLPLKKDRIVWESK